MSPNKIATLSIATCVVVIAGLFATASYIPPKPPEQKPAGMVKPKPYFIDLRAMFDPKTKFTDDGAPIEKVIVTVPKQFVPEGEDWVLSRDGSFKKFVPPKWLQQKLQEEEAENRKKANAVR